MPEKILIVEDEPRNMKVVAMTLKPYGYDLLQAKDGEEALEIAAADHPDLILMDIQLPKMSGVEATQQLRKMPRFKNTPIVALTAYAMKGDKEKFLAAGCDAYLSKPFNTRELPEMVAKMLAERQKKPA